MRDGSSAAACASGEWDGPPKKFAGAREEQFQGTRGARVIPALKLGWSASYPPRGCHPDGASAQRGAADRAARPTRSTLVWSRDRWKCLIPDDMQLSLVQLSLALILPGAPPTRLSGGSRAPGVVAEATRDADKEYASSCYLPTEWTPLMLLEKREYNHDSTLYDFELPEGTRFGLGFGFGLGFS